ncbi:MAG: SpoIIE family protein phosphatase [Candidatus Faecousia sp.]|nr:SpoIIE family protein phosphatase [Candidatus Faecousia sp.]
MKQKRPFTKSLIRPIFNAVIGLIMLLSAAIGTVGYFEFAGALKQQYMEISNGIAEYAALSMDPETLEQYLETKTADEAYNSTREQLQHTADAEDCSVIYVAKVHTDTKEREYIYNVVSKASGFSPYEIGFRDTVNDEFLKVYDSILKGETQLHNFMYSRKGYTTSVYPVEDADSGVVAIVGVVKNMDLLTSAKNSYICQIILIETLIAILSGVVWVVYMRRRIVVPVQQLSEAALNMVEHLEDGNSPELVVKHDDELRELADSFATMYREVGAYIAKLETVTAEKERIGAELDVAAKIQSSMLPCIFPAFPDRNEFDIYATMDPAKEVGGDFYDFFMVDADHLAFVVADVSGKGVPAALFMVIGKTLIKDHTGLHDDLGEVFTEVNNILCASNSEEMFITAFEGVLNLKTGELRYVNAGHEIPFLCRKGGVFEPYKVRAGFVLAGMQGIRYRAGSIQLEPGDKVFQYSDGIPEAINSEKAPYGMKRLESVLAKNSEKAPSELLPLVKADVDAFVGDADQFDDITMLCIEFKGNGRKAEISLTPDAESVKTVAEFLDTTLEAWEIPMKVVSKLQIVADEIYSNIVRYSQAKNAKVTAVQNGTVLSLRFEDDGKPYDPTTAAEPDITASAEEREIGGLGIFVVRNMMDSMDYKYKDGHNVLTLLLATEGSKP